MTTPPPTALSIAGSDPSGGAGIQADLKTFSALGAYGMCALTALTAQNTRGVTGIHLVPPDFVRAQLDTIADDVRIDAVKIGMLATADIAAAVGRFLAGLAERRQGRPHVVLDPVMVATSGDRLLDDDAVAAVTDLLAHADVVTPNVPETAVLLREDPATTPDELRDQARRLRDRHGVTVYAKGGHFPAPHTATDHLVLRDGGEVSLSAPPVTTTSTHGTGCTLSSALAALRPRHEGWEETARAAKAWLTGALAAADTLHIGSGHGPVHHFHELWS